MYRGRARVKDPPGPPREVCWGSWEATPPPAPPVTTMVALQPEGGAVASTPAGRVMGYTPLLPRGRIKGVGAGLGVQVGVGLGLGVPEGVGGAVGEGEGVLLVSVAVPVRARSKVAALVAGLLK